MRKLLFFALLGIITSCSNNTDTKTSSKPADKTRDQIEEKYKWNLCDLYATQSDWEKDKQEVSSMIEKVSKFKGTLGKSASSLYDGLSFLSEINHKFDKLWLYSSLLSDQDTRESAPLAMNDQLSMLSSNYGTVASFVDPELQAIPESKLDMFFKQDKRLEPYRVGMQHLQRMKKYTLSSDKEELLAKAGLMSGLAASANNVLNNADLPYPMVKLVDGTEARIDVSGYSKYRYDSNQENRKIVFNAFFSTLKAFERTNAVLLNGQIKQNIFYRNARGYESTLQASLYPKELPVEVYTNLIANVKKNLDVIQRYLKIRKKMLGLSELHYYDLYPSLVKDVNQEYTYEKGQEIIKNALGVLGQEYVSTLDSAFQKRWIDVYPTPGKASGAYSNSAYGNHPYIKINYNNKFDDVSMLAHELGHTMHSYFSSKHQPYQTAGYASFVAEVASTTNEALLVEDVLKKITEPKEKLAILCNYAESFRQTIFRQTLFAEFEMTINQRTEKGESLSADDFDKLYLQLVREYYGQDKGIISIDDQIACEWAYISHFYLGYYNFTYATSYTASLAIAEKILQQGPEMTAKYIKFLSSGGSKGSIDLLKELGVDMTTNEPFDLAVKKMNRVLDEIEALMDK